MELIPEFTYEAEVSEPLMLGNGPFGARLVVPVAGGWVKGDRISGVFVGNGGDWALVGPDGWARLDVRGQIKSDDGAILYLTYNGLLELTERVTAAMASREEETGYDDQYFRATPRLETGDERYAWVNQSIFVSRGRVSAKGVEYEVYRVS